VNKQNQLLQKSDTGPILVVSFLIPNQSRRSRMHWDQSLSRAIGTLAARPFRGMTVYAYYYVLFPRAKALVRMQN
jgi:hypothetical protein